MQQSDRERWAPKGDPWQVAPFEAQWRPYVTSHWVLLRGWGTIAEAAQCGDEARERWRGQTRVVSQAVVHAEGLGADVFTPERAA